MATNEQTSEFGFISIRNEDGTQWWCDWGMWGSKRLRRATTKEEFERLQAYAPETTKNNSPDNGYFGLMNLKWHPCTHEEAHEQELIADAEERAIDAAYEEELAGCLDPNYN